MTDLAPHYPSRGAWRADLIVHAVGLAFAILGGGLLLGLTYGLGSLRQVAPVSIYVAGLVATLALSAAYNLGEPRRALSAGTGCRKASKAGLLHFLCRFCVVERGHAIMITFLRH
jgi:predicted membrane channel-forming protein YqfA (hemolysin III family)